MADVIRIDTLYFARAQTLRLERRALLDNREYRPAIARGELAQRIERIALDIRDRMAKAAAQ